MAKIEVHMETPKVLTYLKDVTLTGFFTGKIGSYEGLFCAVQRADKAAMLAYLIHTDKAAHTKWNPFSYETVWDSERTPIENYCPVDVELTVLGPAKREE